MTQEALNIAGQCRATASSPLAKNILVDGGSGLLTELLLDAARIIEALAQTQEPVAWEQFYPDIGKPQIALNAEVVGYVAPQRTWVGLTRMELVKCGVLPFGMSYELCQAIEAKLKQKNGYAEENT